MLAEGIVNMGWAGVAPLNRLQHKPRTPMPSSFSLALLNGLIRATNRFTSHDAYPPLAPPAREGAWNKNHQLRKQKLTRYFAALHA